MYRITWTDRNGDSRMLKVHTIRAATDAVKGLQLDRRNSDIAFTRVNAPRRREIVIVVES